MLFPKKRSVSDSFHRSPQKGVRRSTGVEEDDEEQYEGIRCIAVPVLDGENVACGAVSVSIPTLRYRDELVHRAREIAVEQASLISRRMGAG